MCLVLSTLGNVKLWIKWISVQPEKSTMAFGEQICYVSGEMRNDWWENCIMVLKKAEIPWQKPSLAPRVLWFLHLKHFLMKKCDESRIKSKLTCSLRFISGHWIFNVCGWSTKLIFSFGTHLIKAHENESKWWDCTIYSTRNCMLNETK